MSLWATSPRAASFSEIPSSEVIVACTRTIERINKKRVEENRRRIEGWRKPIRKYWIFGKILRWETDEEVLERRRSSDEFFGLEYPSWYAWGSLEVAEKLLDLAKQGQTINVTAEDWNHIS